MEILQHFWITYYKNVNDIIRKKSIHNIIHLSKNECFNKKLDIEEIRVPIDYEDHDSYEHQNNMMFQQLYDITEYIHDKIINNKNILLIGYDYRQDIDSIVTAYFIRYGKLTVHDALLFYKSKKNNIFNPKCLFYFALNNFYIELNKK